MWWADLDFGNCEWLNRQSHDALSKCAYGTALTYGRNYEAINPGGGGRA